MNNKKLFLLITMALLSACNASAPMSNGTSSSSEASATTYAPEMSAPSNATTEQGADIVGATTPATSSSPTIANGEASMLRNTYDQCLEVASGVTPDIQDCIEREYEYQDDRLSKAYQLLLSRLNNNKKLELEAEHKKWLSMRDAECGLDVEAGGQGQRLEANDCFLEITARRAAELEAR
ncbi:lysozyme inhibitor LprI family protein [Lysobacter sp. CFH 32150]|uniref:lysozyme inhibitor LprI family protein n=1 Tax=Lysobacter sp. CFH 32150 TaxID=2927128 RepID=UPI001FA7BC77|nr:lysozyme inhibitor LprI family protein [Lysobacter sp. CFH 32150]MCI4566750.1 lysozyme inhibitor LprI family protein [Lysobacter sp. CFH 32150]